MNQADGHDSTTTILWRWVGRPGHDAASLRLVDGLWKLSGSAVFAEKDRPVRLDYSVICDAAWKTQLTTVNGWIGAREINVEISTTSDAEWFVNGRPQPAMAGCVDIDLNFSPSTNLLPVRRLKLEVGASASIRAAWLRFPSFELEVLEQTYRRVTDNLYEYESGKGQFKASIQVNDAGFATDYGGFWASEVCT